MLAFVVRFLFLSLIAALFSSSALSQSIYVKQGHRCGGRTSLDETFLKVAANGDQTSLKQLLRKGANPDIRDDCEISALTHAVANRQLENVRLLIAAGADVNAIDDFTHEPPIAWAVKTIEHDKDKENAYQIVKALVEAGADVNLKGRSDPTALMLAVERDAEKIVEFLIARKADVNIEEGRLTAYSYAAASGNRRIKAMLLAAGADPNVGVKEYRELYGANAFIQAAADGRTDVLESMLASGVDANYANEAGVTALMRVVNESSLDALLAAGADVNRKDKAGFTALVWAAFFGRVEQVRKLIAAGANVNVVIYDGKSALELAKPEVKELLIAAGAKEQ